MLAMAAQAALEAILTVLLFAGSTGVAYLAIEAVRRAYSDSHLPR